MEYTKTSDIKLLERNPRYIEEDDFDRLKKSIEDNPDYFEARPLILSDRTGELVVIAGNQRLRAARALGLEKVPTFTLHGLTIEREKEITIRDNVSNGKWDFEILANEWNMKDLVEWGVEIPGFKEEKKKEAREDEFTIPANITTDIKPGDLFEIGTHRMICGDSTDPAIYDKLFGNHIADMVLTDPPYNVAYIGKTKDALTIENDRQNDEEFYQFLLKFYTAQAEVTKPGGAWYVWHADSEGYIFRKAFEDSGLLMKQCLIWVKNCMVLGRQDYQWRHEPCLYGWKPGAAHYFIDDRTNTTVTENPIDFKKLKKEELLAIVEELFSDQTPTSIIHADKPSRSDKHPTMKPILLLAPLIQNSSKPGWIVADPFLRSGSTMIAAHQLKRRVFGIELDPQYCQVVVDRMRALDPGIKVIKNGKLI